MSSSNAKTSNVGILWKSIAIVSLLLVLFYTYLFNQKPNYQSSSTFIPFQLKWLTSPSSNKIPPTNITHIGFAVISSINTWKHRNPYTLSWWRPNITRGYVFFEEELIKEYLPWPSSYPPYKINEDIRKLQAYPKLLQDAFQVRMGRTVLDMYRVGDEDLRWVIICDDDTIFMLDNLVQVLRKYDHNKYVYIGGNSECVKSNLDFSFDMGFGGASYALSYPLVKALSTKLDACIERYPHYYSDHMVQSCLADMGIAINLEKGIHQIDLHEDLSGFLSAHPQSPLLTLHHFDSVNPIFPSMDKYESTKHLMKPANFDQSRLLQQTICYQRQKNYSFSVSWGYSTHIYESIIPRSILRKPLETFKPWNPNANPPLYMFNTRPLNNDPCQAPHAFFFDSIQYTDSGNEILTTYVRSWPRNLPSCSFFDNQYADSIAEIRIFSPSKVRKIAGVVECCDVEYKKNMNTTDIKIRPCLKDEVIA